MFYADACDRKKHDDVCIFFQANKECEAEDTRRELALYEPFEQEEAEAQFACQRLSLQIHNLEEEAKQVRRSSMKRHICRRLNAGCI